MVTQLLWLKANLNEKEFKTIDAQIQSDISKASKGRENNFKLCRDNNSGRRMLLGSPIMNFTLKTSILLKTYS